MSCCSSRDTWLCLQRLQGRNPACSASGIMLFIIAALFEREKVMLTCYTGIQPTEARARVSSLTNWGPFDRVWDERANRSLALLREAADTIAEKGSAALEPLFVLESL